MFHLKNLKFLAAAFLFSFLIISCSKENIDDNTIKPGDINPTTHTGQNSLFGRSTTSAEGLDMDCFTVLFPFSIVDNNGDVHIINSDADFFEVLDSANTYYIVDFVYPITIQDESGANSEIINGDALAEVFANCLPNGWTQDLFPAYPISTANSCVSLIYPITVVNDDDRTEQSIANEDELVEAIAEEQVYFVFPLNVVDQTGVTITITEVEGLIDALFSCNEVIIDSTWIGGDFEALGCYLLTYPIHLLLTDGSSVTVEDHMAYCDLLLQGQVVGYEYPLSLTDSDGNTVIVNSDSELESALSECVTVIDIGENSSLVTLISGVFPRDSFSTVGCYTINFPITATAEDNNGQVSTDDLNSMEETFEFISANIQSTLGVQFPVSVVKISDGETVVFNSLQEIKDFLQLCQ